MKVTYQFDPIEENSELEIFHRARDMHSSICSVYNLARRHLKHSDLKDEKTTEILLERILNELRIFHEIG